MATAKPGPILNACIRYATDPTADPPPVVGFRGSLNFLMLAHLTGTLRGRDEDADALEGMFRAQLDGRAGLFADEAGGGYAPIQIAVALVVIRLDRDGRLEDRELAAVARRWIGAVLCLHALCAVVYRDSVLVSGPGSRLRTPVADGLSLLLQLVLGAPPRRFGIRSNSPQDRVEYFWRDADKEAAALHKLMGVPPHKIAAECGVDHREIAQWIARPSAERGLRLAAGLRSLYPLRIRRYREHGALAAWWEVFASHDAPHAGSVVEGDQIHALQPQPIGPRAGKDHQHWSPRDRDDNLVPQTCEIKGRELVATFTTAAGIHNSQGSPIKVQERKVTLPAGDVVLDLLIDLDGAREVRGGETPAPPWKPQPHVPTEPPQPPRPEPPRGDGSVQRILDAFLLMRRGDLDGGADAMERIIRGEL